MKQLTYLQEDILRKSTIEKIEKVDATELFKEQFKGTEFENLIQNNDSKNSEQKQQPSPGV